MPWRTLGPQGLSLARQSLRYDNGAVLGVIAVCLVPAAAVQIALGALGDHRSSVAYEHGVQPVAHEAVVVIDPAEILWDSARARVGALSHQPLTPVRVMPSMNAFCAAKKRMTKGNIIT